MKKLTMLAIISVALSSGALAQNEGSANNPAVEHDAAALAQDQAQEPTEGVMHPPAPELKTRSAETTMAPSSSYAGSIVLPEGTDVHVTLDESLSSATAHIKEVFTGKLADAVTVNGAVVIPAGAVVRGRIADVTNSGRRFHGKNTLTLRPDTIVMADGKELAISSYMIDTYDPKAFRLDDEGSVSTSARHFTKMTMIGAGVGTVAGAVMGGIPGAMAGAGIGAALPAGRWATKDEPVVLDAGTAYWFELTTPARVVTQQAAVAGAPIKESNN